MTAAEDGQRMPAVFFGHGSPMNAIEINRYSAAWAAFGGALSRPRAILSVSAHWFINASAVTAMLKPRTIHDFYGFPDELFAVNYPATGSRDLAEEVSELVKPTWVGLDEDSWGLDHGTWSVLTHAFPAADIPVVQLSLNAQKPLEYHLELGAALAPLRDRGVLIVCSGNAVHNLGLIDWQQPDAGFGWAREFEEATMEMLATDPARLAGIGGHPQFNLAAPTPDHLLPLLYLSGLAAAAGESATPLISGYAMGSLSMTSYTLGAPAIAVSDLSGQPPSTDGQPAGPADESNL